MNVLSQFKRIFLLSKEQWIQVKRVIKKENTEKA